MNRKHNLVGIMLAAVTALYLLTAMITRAFFPRIIIPKPTALIIISLSLAALVLDRYISRESKKIYWRIPIYAFLIFGLFPLAACPVSLLDALKLAVLGAVIFTATTFIFDTVMHRLSSGPAARLAPVAGAFGIYLAAQCLMGII